MTTADREITTTTFTEPALGAALHRLEDELKTGIVISGPVGGVYEWAAKFARAWGRIVVPEVSVSGIRTSGNVLVEVTRARSLAPDDARPIPSSIEHTISAEDQSSLELLHKVIVELEDFNDEPLGSGVVGSPMQLARGDLDHEAVATRLKACFIAPVVVATASLHVCLREINGATGVADDEWLDEATDLGLASPSKSGVRLTAIGDAVLDLIETYNPNPSE